VVPGNGPTGGDEPDPDPPVADASVADATVPDASVADATVPDASVAEACVTEPSVTGAPVIEAPVTAPPQRRARRRLRSGTGRAPWPLAVPAAIAVTFLLLPLLGLVVRAPWRDLPRLLSDPQALTALRLSLFTATTATAVSLLLGVPLAWVLARSRWRLAGLLRALVTLPLVLPPVVGGVALLLALGRRGVIGQFLDAWFGITLPFTTAGVVVAETFVAMPFLVVTVEGALRSVDAGLEDAAATLGARPFTIFRRVTLPLVTPSLIAGGVLCWARALGEFGATITFAGNYPGRTQTMPIEVYLLLETDPDAAIALSLVLLAVSVTALALLRDRWLRPGARRTRTRRPVAPLTAGQRP
jgi:molybdate transport system permease protein